MDESVLAAMSKWPNVPAVSGWLSLDERGHWRLRDEPITHPGLIEFINRNYEADGDGRWYFQNGPQRVYVTLAYTPLVLHVDADGVLRDQAGRGVSRIEGACLDEEGNLVLDTDFGPGVVDSDALPCVSEWLIDERGDPLTAEALDGLHAQRSSDAYVSRAGERVALERITRADVPHRFGFVPDPEPPDNH